MAAARRRRHAPSRREPRWVLGTGVALGTGVETWVTTTWTPAFGFPLVMTGTPAALRQIPVESPTSAVTT